MIPKQISDIALETAIDDAPEQMGLHGVQPDNPRYPSMARLMVCHLLYMRGFARTLLSAGVGDLSTAYADINFGDKEGMSPYLYEFLKLLPQSPFVISI